MLPSVHRLRRSSDFTSAVRRGARARSGRLVVHQHRGEVSVAVPEPARVGLIVGRAVGTSVVRHRLSRQLRAQLSQRLEVLPDASVTVVRALPAASGASSAVLGRDLDHALSALARRR